jgi:hypothetical protein
LVPNNDLGSDHEGTEFNILVNDEDNVKPSFVKPGFDKMLKEAYKVSKAPAQEKPNVDSQEPDMNTNNNNPTVPAQSSSFVLATPPRPSNDFSDSSQARVYKGSDDKYE